MFYFNLTILFYVFIKLVLFFCSVNTKRQIVCHSQMPVGECANMHLHF